MQAFPRIGLHTITNITLPRNSPRTISLSVQRLFDVGNVQTNHFLLSLTGVSAIGRHTDFQD